MNRSELNLNHWKQSKNNLESERTVGRVHRLAEHRLVASASRGVVDVSVNPHEAEGVGFSEVREHINDAVVGVNADVLNSATIEKLAFTVLPYHAHRDDAVADADDADGEFAPFSRRRGGRAWRRPGGTQRIV